MLIEEENEEETAIMEVDEEPEEEGVGAEFETADVLALISSRPGKRIGGEWLTWHGPRQQQRWWG